MKIFLTAGLCMARPRTGIRPSQPFPACTDLPD